MACKSNVGTMLDPRSKNIRDIRNIWGQLGIFGYELCLSAPSLTWQTLTGVVGRISYLGMSGRVWGEGKEG